MNDIDVLHRYGAPRHYLPLERLVADDPNTAVNYYEFTFASNPRRVPRNLSYLSRTASGLAAERTILLGAEPYDVRLPLFRRLASNYPLIYHTSWPHWGPGEGRRTPLVPGHRDRWLGFLTTVPVVTVTRHAKRSLAANGVDARHIPHGVDTNIYNPDAGTSDGPVTVLFVGRLEPRKGVDDLVELCREGLGDDVRFRFVGDGPMREDVERLTESANAVYDGYVSDDAELAEIYASADLFVLPSRPTDVWEELFGIVLIEAMACGLPVVGTDCVGPKEIIDDGETGVVVDANDYDALESAVKRLVDDEALRTRMGAAGVRTVEATYALDAVTAEWAAALESVE